MAESSHKPTRIVIIGGGFAGAACAVRLEKLLDPDQANITLINRTNYFEFTPLLIEAGTGALEPRHAVVPLRRSLHRTVLHMANADHVDLANRRVVTRTFDNREHTIEFDHLVIALGSVTSLPDVPGLKEFGYGVKRLADAVSLRDRAVGMLELANETQDEGLRRQMLGFVVVGGNYSGVEVAAEFHAFLTEATRVYRNLKPSDIHITLVDREPRILHTLDEELSDYASHLLKKRGLELRLQDTVTKIEADAVVFKDDSRAPTRTVIWAAGIAPPPLVAKLDVPKDDHGYILCDPELNVKGHDQIWAIGDCAVNPDPNGDAYPPTAQHAAREGDQAARNIVAVFRGEKKHPLVYHTKGMMAPLGMYKGVARIMGFKLSGLPAWMIWRTFYLLRMPGWGRSLRVLMDWTLDWCFRRDYVQLGIHGSHEPQLKDKDDSDN